jgi:tetratricopeptide (TPR) repeat protein
MQKQRRVEPRRISPKTSKPSASLTQTHTESVKRPNKTSPSSPLLSSPRRTTYVEAIARYEQGCEALQRRDFCRAAELLRSVLTDYPDEKELHERVRLYLNICERQAAPREASPRTLDERVYAATLALNAGQYDRALEHLQVVLQQQPTHDHAEYMLAVVDAARGNTGDALAHLQRSLELNPENRALALQDPDLEPLRDEEGFRVVVDTASAGRYDRRRAFKARGPR